MNRRNVGILLFDGVEVLDFAGPFEVFSRTRLDPGVESRRSDDSAPFRVFTVARSTDFVRATGDLKVIPHFSFEDVPPIELLVVPGGFGTRALLEDDEVLGWIRSTAAAAQQVTSVCTGSFILATAGLLKGKRATSHWMVVDQLELFGAIPVFERVVEDGNIITGAGVSSGIDFGLTLAARLHGEAAAKCIQLLIEYDPQPPFDSGSVATADSATVDYMRNRGADMTASRRRSAERIGREL